MKDDLEHQKKIGIFLKNIVKNLSSSGGKISQFTQDLEKFQMSEKSLDQYLEKLRDGKKANETLDEKLERLAWEKVKMHPEIPFGIACLQVREEHPELFQNSGFQEKTAGGKLDALVQRKMKINPELSYGMAFSEAQLENPELTETYIQELPR